jgi:ABC-type Mn2+/Zn2+ transport system permease subunit
VIPATSARLLGRRIASVTVLSVFFGIFSMILGLFASGTWDLPPGASVVLAQSALFFLSLVFRAR